MADVKWIKIVTDVFEDEKILIIDSDSKADSIIVIWFKLLCLAGKQNNGGVFLIGGKPYTEETFATVFRRPINTVKNALKVFENLGMIEIVNGTVTITNWEKHQSLDAYEKKKERDRLYQAERRATKKEIAKKSSDTSSDIVSKSREEKRKEEIRVDKIRLEESNECGENSATCDTTNEEYLVNVFEGDLGVVCLSMVQKKDLIERMGHDYYNWYVDKLAKFILEKRANVKSCYETILKWYEEDSQASKKKAEKKKVRYGNFDPAEAFQKALERSYADLTEEDSGNEQSDT